MSSSAIEYKPLIRLELQSDPRMLSGVREMVSAVARRLGFDQLSSGQIALAVDEALANVICHGYGRRSDRPIWLSVYENPPHEPAIRIVVEDEAPAVACDNIKGRELSEIRPGGLGVHIIKEVMDAAVYEPRERVGMRLTMSRAGNRVTKATRTSCEKETS